MKTEDLKEFFDANFDEYLHFERVENKTTNRPDMEAFLMLDKQYNSNIGIIGSAIYEEVCLNVDIDKIDLTEDDVIKLLRCGIRFNSDYDCLSMFV